MDFTSAETKKLETYLQKKLNPKLGLKARAKSGDSVEILLDGEYVGTVYKDDEDGETSYDINISVLSIDLDNV